jgi:hypothetical protein
MMIRVGRSISAAEANVIQLLHLPNWAHHCSTLWAECSSASRRSIRQTEKFSSKVQQAGAYGVRCMPRSTPLRDYGALSSSYTALALESIRSTEGCGARVAYGPPRLNSPGVKKRRGRVTIYQPCTALCGRLTPFIAVAVLSLCDWA